MKESFANASPESVPPQAGQESTLTVAHGGMLDCCICSVMLMGDTRNRTAACQSERNAGHNIGPAGSKGNFRFCHGRLVIDVCPRRFSSDKDSTACPTECSSQGTARRTRGHPGNRAVPSAPFVLPVKRGRRSCFHGRRPSLSFPAPVSWSAPARSRRNRRLRLLLRRRQRQPFSSSLPWHPSTPLLRRGSRPSPLCLPCSPTGS